MRYFEVPFNVSEEDKIIGGYLSLRQFAWVVLSVFSAVILFLAKRSNYIVVTTFKSGGHSVSINPVSLMIRFVILLVIVVWSVLCAFYKVNDTYNFDKYCFKLLKLKFRQRIFNYKK